jgi:hypothetical protein
MPSSNRLIEKTAILLAALWIGFAILVVVELIGHLIDKTSDTRSQFWRVMFVIIFTVSAFACLFRFRRWRWIVLVLCLFIAIRDYFYLMVPRELSWSFDQIIAAARFMVTLATIAIAVLWGRSAGPDKAQEHSLVDP